MSLSGCVWHGGHGKRPQRTERHTWSAPFNSNLYDDQLMEMRDKAKDDLGRAAGGNTWTMIDRPTSRTSWTNLSVMFAGATSARTPRADDASSVVSASSKVSGYCYLCTTMDDHQRNHVQRKKMMALTEDGSVYKLWKQRMQYKAPMPRSARRSTEMTVAEPVCSDALYKVTVWTGDFPGASTDANVYITITGEQGTLQKTRLCRLQGSNKVSFVRGSKEAFHLKGPKLGSLRNIIIEHDGLESRHSWYVDKVEVQCMQTGKVWIFPCSSWLSMHHADFTLRRKLEASLRQRICREFEVTVETGTKRLAGTSGNVYIALQGTEGVTYKYHLNSLNSNGMCFQRGQTDKFRIKVFNIGDIRSLRVEHDGKGSSSGWYLNKVTIQDVHQPQCVYYFVYNGWIAKDMGDGRLWRQIPARKRLPMDVLPSKPVHYEVTVKTGSNLYHSSMKMDVYVIFVGFSGKTDRVFLDGAQKKFERGTESFQVKTDNAGRLTSLVIGHDSTSLGAGWFCEHVKVRKQLSRQEIAELLTQLKQAWKAEQEQQHRFLAEKSTDEDKENNPGDDDEDRREINDDAAAPQSMESKQDADTSGSKSARGRKGPGKFAGMFDRNGRVLKVPLYEEYFFPCSQWFASDKSDGLLERELKLEKQTLLFETR